MKPLVEYLKALDAIDRVTIAGSYRRRKSTIGDLDILVCGNDSEKIMKYFNDYEDVSKVLSSGETRSTVILNDGIQVDLRLVKNENYGSALQYFTGSAAHGAGAFWRACALSPSTGSRCS